MKTKKQKRKIKLKGRIVCHGSKKSCVELFELGQHRAPGKKTPKGTKPIKKIKKVYEKRNKRNNN